MLKNKKIIIPLVIFLISIILFIFYYSKNTESTDNAYLKSDIIIIKPKITGYIKEVLVVDNQKVKAGDILAKIDDSDYKLKVKFNEASIDSTNAKIEALKEKINIQEIEINNTILKENSAKNSLDVASKELKRAEFLIKDRATSQQDLDKKREIEKNLNNEYIAAKASTQASITQKGVLILELEQLKSELVKEHASFELAKIDLDNTLIKAASDGFVSTKSLQIGQLATPNTALGYLVQDNIWVLANFKETQIGKMKIGQETDVYIDSLDGKKFKAQINSLSPVTGSELSILPPENATGNFTKIVQRVPIKITFASNQDLSNLKSGLSCTVKVHLNE